ncbi:hypothetical protein [Caenispirillum bisanense]|uniref:hypothetical protein n=1 Tax=Caenispirillum bisanense TaxID=414052 RepID=UPI0031D420C5
MAGFDLQALVKNIDPRFRQQETMEYNRLVQQAEVFREAGIVGNAAQEERFDQAARMIAASIYVIARDLKLAPGDVGVVAGHAVGFFVGASSPADARARDQFKAVFAKALDQANGDKPRSMVMMADMVETGMQIMKRYRNGA